MRFAFKPFLATAVLVTVGTFALFSVSFAASVTLAWDKPQDGSLIEGYKIYYGKAEGIYGRPLTISKAKIDRDNQNNPTYIVTVNALSPGQQYFFAVTAYNRYKYESGHSNEVSGKVLSYVIKTIPPGRQVVVNSTTSAAPKTFYWAADVSPPLEYEVSIPSPQTSSSGTTRYLYSSWNDGGNQNRMITPPSSKQIYTVSFSTQYSLTTSVNIAEAGSITVTPEKV